jgi:predicted Zn finger-like uncharacterized protein
MDVSCPACAARYTADDEKLRGKTARMRCKACNTVWLVAGPGAKSASSPPPSADAPASAFPSPHPIMIESPPNKRAAVAKRGAEREKRDLFAARAEDEGSVKETILPPPSTTFTGNTGVGARNENSVLFRVDQLARTAPLPAAASSTAAEPKLIADEEGVIDLKALSSAPPRPMGMPVPPLFSEPPPVTMEVASQPNARPRSWAAIFGAAAAALVVLVVAGFGIAFAFRGEEPVKRTAAVVVPPPPAPPPPAASSAPPPEPPPAVAEDSKDIKGKKGKRKAGRGAAAGPITNKSAPPAAKTVKPADPCGCHGDFNCILACTAKGGK